MTFNLPSRVRLAVYVTLGLGTIIIRYLIVKHIIGEAERELWDAFVIFAGGLAALNVASK